MRTKAGIIGFFFVFAVVAGCAQAPIKPPTDLPDQYISKAQELEAKGDLVEALEQYKVALTVDPQNELAKDKIEQIEPTLRERAEKNYQNGLAFYRKGEYSRARQEFLTALRYNPDHGDAKKMLQEHVLEEQQVKGYVLHAIQPDESISMLAKKYYGDPKKFQIIAEYNELEDATKVRVGQEIKVPVVEGMLFFGTSEEIISVSGEISKSSLTEVIPVKSFTIHTVEPGESLSKVALRYYGDYKKFPIIAQYNQLDENASLRVGQKIKIPEIEGVPLAAKPMEEDVGQAETPVPSAALEEPPAGEKEEEKEEVEEDEKELAAVDQSANYRELGIEFFKEKDYLAAISEFKKVLNVNPTDKTALEYISASHFEQGLIVFGKEDYLTARDEFKASLEYNEDCEKCGEYIKKCEETYMDIHYNRGVSYFGDEKLAQAVQEWELVYDIDPGYKDVESNLKKARKLLERLESIKRSKMKE
ncbi:MAG: LysM peptidoglycan-binding domain-containing protein [Deltaproteobacteria bacterium]|nr:MAG: LysM peptidoglycan-binding domain-containing protein [Deltaproteobacteria bacterium]